AGRGIVEIEHLASAERDRQSSRVEADALRRPAQHENPSPWPGAELRSNGAPSVRNVVSDAGNGRRLSSPGYFDQHMIRERDIHEFGESSAELRSGRRLQAIGCARWIDATRIGEAATATLTATAGKLKGYDDGIARHAACHPAGFRHHPNRFMAHRERTGEHPAPRPRASCNVEIEVASPDRDRTNERVGLRG